MAYTTIDDPTDYFNTVLYTGNTSGQSITGVGFQPDFLWVKARSNAYQHSLRDVIRGSTKTLRANDTNTEQTQADSVTSFDSDGFTLGADTSSFVNQNSSTYVAWNWLAANGTASNTDGSITTTVSANTTAGFSIVSYTGNNTIGATIGHGLGVAPAVIIFKNRDSAVKWVVYHHKNTSTPETDHLVLNDTDATADDDSILNDTAPSSSVITMKTSSSVNSASTDYIAYCFNEVKGFSKFGSYTGNGSTDGPFVYTGFKPAWIMGKRTDSANNWYMFDSTRNTSNVTDKKLRADETTDENVNSSKTIDIVSNGFKVRSSDPEFNASGGSYVYMAFAESPFITSGVKLPTTAR